MYELTDIWKLAACGLKEKLPADMFNRWIANIVPVELKGETLVLGVPNFMFVAWLEDNYKPVIEGTIYETTGMKLSVSFKEGHQKTAHSETAPVAKAQPKETHVDTANKSNDEIFGAYSLDRRFTFESFVVGDNNKFAYSACRSVANAPGESLNPLFIHSSTGLGKTHLMQAIAHEILKNKPDAKILYINSEDMLNEYVEAMQKQKPSSFRKKFRNMDVLLIDDIQFIGPRQGFQEEIFHTFNALYNAHKQIVLTSDRPPHEIQGLEKRLVSRFEWGLTADINLPDLETRMAIIRKKQENQKYKLSDDVVTYIASKLKSNVRRLESAVFKLVSWASLSGMKIDVKLAEKLLGDVISEESGKIATVEEIQKIVAEYYELRVSDMTSKKRPTNIAWPRMVAMYFSRNMTELSLQAIADKFERNHATVLHACTSVTKRVSSDDDFRNDIAQMERKLKNL